MYPNGLHENHRQIARKPSKTAQKPAKILSRAVYLEASRASRLTLLSPGRRLASMPPKKTQTQPKAPGATAALPAPSEEPWFASMPNMDAQYCQYMSTEWGHPEHGERDLFESLTLEGAQAGLSWR